MVTGDVSEEDTKLVGQRGILNYVGSRVIFHRLCY